MRHAIGVEGDLHIYDTFQAMWAVKPGEGSVGHSHGSSNWANDVPVDYDGVNAFRRDDDAGGMQNVLWVDYFSDHGTTREYCSQRCLAREDCYGPGGDRWTLSSRRCKTAGLPCRLSTQE